MAFFTAMVHAVVAFSISVASVVKSWDSLTLSDAVSWKLSRAEHGVKVAVYNFVFVCSCWHCLDLSTVNFWAVATASSWIGSG